MPTVPVDGIRLYYEERGSGAPVLLIHGTGGHLGLFAGVVDQLASSYRVITYDRRGFGRSEAPPPEKDYLRRHADDAAALLREIGAPHATVVGWGMGGVVALALGFHHRDADAASKILLYDAPLHAKKHGGVRLASAMGGAIALGKVGMHRRGAKRFLRFSLGYDKGGGGAFDELDPKVREQMLAGARSIIAELEAGTGEELSLGDLAKVRSPVGIVVGTKSARFLTAAADRCAAIFPSARIVRMPNGDHVMNIRHPEVLVRALQDAMPSALTRL